MYTMVYIKQREKQSYVERKNTMNNFIIKINKEKNKVVWKERTPCIIVLYWNGHN